MYPHVRADASGLAALRTAVAPHLRALAAVAHPGPVLAGPAYALAEDAPGRAPVRAASRAGGGRAATPTGSVGSA
ncbi:RNA polymerase subunit sigma-24, partial [Streptomyces alkaliphilus]|nr:RNA polymerase subunit sigma-24 [Streptomyces alkaliphilus]